MVDVEVRRLGDLDPVVDGEPAAVNTSQPESLTVAVTSDSASVSSRASQPLPSRSSQVGNRSLEYRGPLSSGAKVVNNASTS